MTISPEPQARLVQLAFLILPPKTGRHHRARVAHDEVEQVLAGAVRASDGRSPEAVYELLRGRVVIRALAGGASRGLRVSMGAGGDVAGAARDEALTRLTPPARAAYALRHLEGLDAGATIAVLGGLGVPDPHTAVKLAESHGPDPVCLTTMEIPATGVVRRRRKVAVAAVAVVALAIPGAALAGSGGGGVTPGVTQVQEGKATVGATKKKASTSTAAAAKAKAGKRKATGTSGTVRRTAVTKPAGAAVPKQKPVVPPSAAVLAEAVEAAQAAAVRSAQANVAAERAAARKAAAREATAREATAREATAREATAREATVRKDAARRAAARKAAAAEAARKAALDPSVGPAAGTAGKPDPADVAAEPPTGPADAFPVDTSPAEPAANGAAPPESRR